MSTSTVKLIRVLAGTALVIAIALALLPVYYHSGLGFYYDCGSLLFSDNNMICGPTLNTRRVIVVLISITAIMVLIGIRKEKSNVR